LINSPNHLLLPQYPNKRDRPRRTFFYSENLSRKNFPENFKEAFLKKSFPIFRAKPKRFLNLITKMQECLLSFGIPAELPVIKIVGSLFYAFFNCWSLHSYDDVSSSLKMPKTRRIFWSGLFLLWFDKLNKKRKIYQWP